MIIATAFALVSRTLESEARRTHDPLRSTNHRALTLRLTSVPPNRRRTANDSHQQQTANLKLTRALNPESNPRVSVTPDAAPRPWRRVTAHAMRREIWRTQQSGRNAPAGNPWHHAAAARLGAKAHGGDSRGVNTRRSSLHPAGLGGRPVIDHGDQRLAGRRVPRFRCS